MKKQLLFISVLLILLLMVTACGKKQPTGSETASPTDSVETSAEDGALEQPSEASDDADGQLIILPEDEIEDTRKKWCLHKNVTSQMLLLPTCTEKGKLEYVCSDCGKTLSTVPVPPSGHSLTASGGKLVCSACDYTEESTAENCAHSYKISRVSVSCTGWGYTLHTCTLCGASFTDGYTQPYGHSYISKVVKEPDCVTCGETSHTCCLCSDTFTTQTDPLGHEEVTDPQVPATCTSAGLTSGSHCSRCGKTVKEQTAIPKTDHSYENGVCTVCGAKADASSATGNTGGKYVLPKDKLE